MGKRAKARSLTVATSGPIERQDLRQRVGGRIVELIRTGNLRPGDRLPPETASARIRPDLIIGITDPPPNMVWISPASNATLAGPPPR